MLELSPNNSFFKKIHIFVSCHVHYSTTAASFSISLCLVPGYETAKRGPASVHKIVLRDSLLPSSQEIQAHIGQIPIPSH